MHISAQNVCVQLDCLRKLSVHDFKIELRRQQYSNAKKTALLRHLDTTDEKPSTGFVELLQVAEIDAKKEHEMQHEGAIIDLGREYSQHRLFAYALLLPPALLQALEWLDKELAADKAKKEKQDAIFTALKQQKTERTVATVAPLKEATTTIEAAAAEAT